MPTKSIFFLMHSGGFAYNIVAKQQYLLIDKVTDGQMAYNKQLSYFITFYVAHV